jgi:hypothetical protein
MYLRSVEGSSGRLLALDAHAPGQRLRLLHAVMWRHGQSAPFAGRSAIRVS